MKLYATIDAPIHIVCRYLSQEHRYREYNSLLIDQKDIEHLTPVRITPRTNKSMMRLMMGLSDSSLIFLSPIFCFCRIQRYAGVKQRNYVSLEVKY